MKGRILLVDDENSILSTLAQILERSGFTVATVASAQAAKEALSDGTFELVITDVCMETANSGYEVAECAARKRPRPATIILTGYSLGEQWRSHGAQAILAKPASVPELLTLVEELLGDPPHEGAA
jgi:two-component system, cell cycle response regulator CpdR